MMVMVVVVVVVVLVLVVGSGGLSCPFLFLFPSVFLSPISYISRLFLTVYLSIHFTSIQKHTSSSVASSIKKGGWEWLIHR